MADTPPLLLVQRPQSTPESNGHGSAPLIVHVDPIPVSTTAEQCMAEPDRPELDHVLFGVARDLIVRGDSPDLPRGWDRLRRQIRPGRRSFFTARASSERLTTDALDWWKSFAEGRIDVTEHLTDLVERATGCLPSRATGCQPSPAAAVSHLTPVAHGLVAEHLEQQAFLVSPDWPTYLVNIWLIATRLAEPEIRRAHETATELDLSSALYRLPRADGGVVVQQHRGQRCPEASVAAARQHHCIWPQLCRLTQCILHYQADRKERRRIAAREGRPLEPTPYACTGSRGSELPPTLPLTYFEWEVRPLFYPRDAHDRTERAGVSVALERGDLIGPFALITQFPLEIRRTRSRDGSTYDRTNSLKLLSTGTVDSRASPALDSDTLGLTAILLDTEWRSTRTNTGEGWQT